MKKGPEESKEHKESSIHKTAHAKSVRVQPSISTICTWHCLETQQLRRQGLISHIQTLKTLLCQGIVIGGRTDSESYIYQFNLDKAINDKTLELILNENRYVNAHDILKKRKQMLVLSVSRHLKDNILKRNLFSLLSTNHPTFPKRNYECLQGLSSDTLIHYTLKDIFKVRYGWQQNGSYWF